MADFPTSKHTFSNFANGATSDAAQVTDIYAEVEAIEDGYLNGTARLNSSNSTVTNLSVSGGSTLGGALVVNGAATFNGVVTLPSRDSARLMLNAHLDTPHNSTLAIAWSTATFKTNSSLHSTASNQTRLVPQSTGVWEIQATLVGNANTASTAYLEAVIEDSSGGVIGVNRGQLDNSGVPTANAFGYKYFDSLAASPFARVVVKSVYAASTTSLDFNQTACHFGKR